MGSRAGHLVVAICLAMLLSIIGVFVTFGSVEQQRTTQAASLSYERTDFYITPSSLVTPTLEPRVYLPAVMRDFCTPISIPVDAKLFGVAFFDYNGDGSQQPNEPGIVGANISIGSESISSQCKGIYYFRNLPNGSYNLVVTAAGFRYLSLSRSDFKTIGTPVPVTVSGNTQRNVGLMQGFLTLPYYRATANYVQEYFDYDPEYYKYLWWDLQRGTGIRRNHSGIDLGVYENGVPVVAPAPARVRETWADPNGGWCLNAEVSDGTIYWVCHITLTVTANQTVSRGDLIGYVNFPSAPHVHLSVGLLKITSNNWYFDIRDTHVPLDPNMCAEWRYWGTGGGDPEYVKTDCSPGYWTVKNSPQHFD